MVIKIKHNNKILNMKYNHILKKKNQRHITFANHIHLAKILDQ